MNRNYVVLPILAGFALCMFSSLARADNVTLTSGTAATLAGGATVNLLSTTFSLHYLGEHPSGISNMIGMNSVTSGLGIPNVTFNGIESRFFSGVLSFNDFTLTGGVTAYQTMDDMFFHRSPLFTVNFNAPGFVTLTQVPGVGTETKFTVATPEPASLILLGTALLSGAIAKRSRRKLARKSVTDLDSNDD